MKRRLMVAKAMVHNPPVLILDEPTAGVDVELRRQLWAYVLELNRKGVTIVLTTHYLEEAQELCDQIAIINRGQVVACEPTTTLLARMDTRKVLVTPQEPMTQAPPRSDVEVKPAPVKYDTALLDRISALVQSKAVKPTVTAVFPLSDAVKAYEHVMTGHARGKVMLDMGK